MFSQLILNWYSQNQRDLPWRNTNDPYLIWLSEIILQQTRVDQGLPYYYRFAEKYPTINTLSEAHESEVLKLWQGLGYYSRARNMLVTAKQLAQEHRGKFPGSYDALLKLKGIGPYTAAAIASFAFNAAHAVVDGNVQRVLARYFGIAIPVDSPKGKKLFTKLAQELLDKNNPANYNQAIMEFGAMQCKPARPLCNNCPLAASCAALANNAVSSFPVKSGKVKLRHRYFNYLVINNTDGFYLKKRGKNDIWANMYDFPLIESTAELLPEALLCHKEYQDLIGGNEATLVAPPKTVKHILSHQVIFAKFWVLKLQRNNLHPVKNAFLVNEEGLSAYALPKLIENYLK